MTTNGLKDSQIIERYSDIKATYNSIIIVLDLSATGEGLVLDDEQKHKQAIKQGDSKGFLVIGVGSRVKETEGDVVGLYAFLNPGVSVSPRLRRGDLVVAPIDANYVSFYQNKPKDEAQKFLEEGTIEGEA